MTTSWNPHFEEDAFQIDVILKNKLPAERERIRIEYAQIWSLERIHQAEKPKSAQDWVLFHDSAKLKFPPVDSEEYIDLKIE